MPIRIKINQFKRITVNRSTICVMILFLGLMTLCAFRPIETTSDTRNYYGYYLNADVKAPVPELSFVVIAEFWRMAVGGILGFRLLFLTYYAAIFALLYCLIRESSHPLISIAIFFAFAFSLQVCIQVRAPVANLVLLLSLKDISNRKPRSFYIKAGIAFLIHSSSIIYIIVYPICRLLDKVRSRWIMYGMPIAAVIVARIIGSKVPLLINYGIKLGLHDLERYQVYFQHKYASAYINPVNRVSIALFILYYVILLVVRVRRLSSNEINYVFIMAYSIFFYFLAYYSIAIIGFRIPETLNLVLILAIPDLVDHVKEGNKRMIYIVLFLYLIIIAIQYNTLNVVLSCLRLT